LYSGYELWRLRLSSFGGYRLALAALALVKATQLTLVQKPPARETSKPAKTDTAVSIFAAFEVSLAGGF